MTTKHCMHGQKIVKNKTTLEEIGETLKLLPINALAITNNLSIKKPKPKPKPK